MPGISRDPDRARRQLQGLATSNSRVAEALGRGELPGFRGPLEGTEHLAPEAAAAAPPRPAGPAPVASPVEQAPVAPSSPRRAAVEIHTGSYDQQEHAHAEDPEPTPEPTGPGDDGADAGPAPAARRGPLAQLADGFRGRL